ncbi:MAG: hypothetical protein FWF71_00805 [Actinomycetia bacterium]|nr:hypothetical protein [Actinomycetes bacterium]
MRVAINNRIYDPSTATALGSFTRRGIRETLYRKKNGEYFVHMYNDKAEGNKKNGWHGKEKIVPCSIQDAKDWAATHLNKNQDKFNELF